VLLISIRLSTQQEQDMSKDTNPKQQNVEMTPPSEDAPAFSPDSMPAPQKGHIGKDKDNAEPGSGAH